MKILLIVLQIIFSTYWIQCSENIKGTREIELPRYGITFGQDASIEDYPHFCKIWIKRNGETYFCGGTIVNCNTVLTAAHCVFNADLVLVCFGSNKTKNTDYCQLVHDMNMVNIHKGFLEALKVGHIYDDIATVKVPGNFCTTTIENVNVATLCQKKVNTSCDVYNGTIGKAIGCGNTESGFLAEHLQQADQLITTNQKGLETFPALRRYVWKYSLCFTVSTKDPRTSTCVGDSGSPLLIQNEKTKEMEVCGIVSFGTSDCTTGLPSAFTYLNKYLDFIHSQNDSVSLENINLSENLLHQIFRNFGRQLNPKGNDIWIEFEKRNPSTEATPTNNKNTKGGNRNNDNKIKKRLFKFLNNWLNFLANIFETD